MVLTDAEIVEGEGVWQRQHFNPSRTIMVNDGPEIAIGAGTSDELIAYSDDGGLVYVVTDNSNLGYLGLDVFKGSERVGEFFVRDESHALEVLGPKGTDYHPRTVIRRLREYIEVADWGKDCSVEALLEEGAYR